MRALSFFLATSIFMTLSVSLFAQSAGDLETSPAKDLSTGIHDEPKGVAEGADDLASAILKKANIAHQ